MTAQPRPWYASRIAGALVGVFAGGLTIMVVEYLGHRAFGTADPADPTTVTAPMFLSVLVAWVLGCWVAGFVATRWAATASLAPGLGAGLLLLGGAIANMFFVPHPAWMLLAAILLMPAAAYVSARTFATRTS